MIAAYLLLSHNYECLPTQVRLLRKNIAGLSRIIPVEGPWGKAGMVSAGGLRLTAEARNYLGLDGTLESPKGIAGYFWADRVAKIIEYVAVFASTQSERYALILHGDLLPVASVSIGELLQGKPVAARIRDTILSMTWFAVDREVGGCELLAPSIQGCIGNAAKWKATPVTTENANSLIGFMPDGYEDSWHFEYCRPCWLHLDKVSVLPGAMQGKLASVARHLGISAYRGPCLTKQVNGLHYHQARV